MKLGVWRHAFFACACAGMAIWWWSQRFAAENAAAPDTEAPVLTLHAIKAYRYGENGLREDTLQADTVHYYSDDRDTLFTRPRLRRDTATGHLEGEGNSGRYAPDGSITLEGDALMRRFSGNSPDISVQSRILHYSPAAQTLASDETVTITTPESHTTSLGALWQLEHNSLILKQNVRSRYEPSLRR